ncbi:MAG: LamG domain-containing protein, partial [Lewinella sp.]|nr:LamG domain-containing protein [Lewinella sp.]
PAAALSFDGVNDIVKAPYSPALELVDGTIELWLKPRSLSRSQTFIAYRSNNGAKTRYLFNLRPYLTAIGFWNGQGYQIIPYNFTANAWQHLAIVDDGTKTQVFVNGNHIGDFTLQFSTFSGPDMNLVLGQDIPLGEFYYGEMDEVRIWNRARCETEIQGQMDCELAGSEDGLVAYYQFNEGEAAGNNAGLTTLPDITGNGHNGTLYHFALNGPGSNWVAPGSVASGVTCSGMVSCEPGAALDFDGDDDRIPTTGTDLNLSGAVTIEAWVKPNEKFDFSTILSNKTGGGENAGFTFAINTFQTSNGKLLFETQSAEVISEASVSWGEWQHVAVTYDGTVAKMYINGVDVGTTPASNVNLNVSPNPTIIGDFFDYVFSNGKFDGQMDELRVWSRALCGAELQAYMNCELNGTEDGLLAYYQFNEGFAGANNAGVTMLPDVTGNGNDGTLNDFALDGPTSNWIAPGAVETGVTCEPFVDDIPPTLDCAGLNTTLGTEEGECFRTVDFAAEELIPAFDDNCMVASFKVRYRLNNEGETPGDWSGWTELNLEDPQYTLEELAPGRYQIRWRVTDGVGLTDACSRYLTIADQENPTVECQPVTIDFNGENAIALDPANFIATSDDNCGIVLSYTDPTYVTCDQLGEVITVTVTVEDEAGNPASCIAELTIDGLPCGWMTWDDHVDCPGSSADYDVPSETFTVTSADCSHTPYSPTIEEYAYVKTTLCGNGELIAHVDNLDGLGKAWAGIVM